MGRTRRAGRLGAGWVGPYWLERQTDPASPAFVPDGPGTLTNRTGRNWTTIGTVGSSRSAIVDPRGLVTPWLGGWSLDWWVGADDRWHHPSRETGVRQRLVDDAPVVETAMRVPGGDVLHRAYAVRTGSAGGAELVVVEVENATPVPVALAFAVRPYDHEGVGGVRRIELVGTTVVVDGRAALVFPRPPARVAASTSKDGDSAVVLTSGGAGTTFPRLRDRAGLASAAFVVPLPHTAVIRVVMPMAPPRPARRRASLGRRAVPAPSVPAALPAAAAVARGWRAHADRGLRIVVPDPRLAACVEAQRRFLLLLHQRDDPIPAAGRPRGFGVRDAVFLAGALDRYGYPAEAAGLLRRYPARQRADGSFGGPQDGVDGNGPALDALAEHWRLHRDRSLLDEAVPTVVKGAEWIERNRHRRGAVGLLDGGFGPNLWGVRGLGAAAELLTAAGEERAAGTARRYADAFRSDLEAALADRLGTAAVPTGPDGGLDAGMAGSLAACFPLRLYGHDDRRIRATVACLRDRFLIGAPVRRGDGVGGLDPVDTLQLALVEVEAGDLRALDRLRWLLDAATPTWTWPEAVEPTLGTGCAGPGHHGRAAADLLTLVRNLLVRETADGLALCTLVPEAWRGAGIEVHDAPTPGGHISFAVRWHGDRPALLWDLEPADGAPAVRLTAPGLDPSWSTRERRGDALLAPPGPGRAARPEGSFR